MRTASLCEHTLPAAFGPAPSLLKGGRARCVALRGRCSVWHSLASNGRMKPASPRSGSELSVTVTQPHLSLSFPRVNITHTHTCQALSLVMNPDSEDKLLRCQ